MLQGAALFQDRMMMAQNQLNAVVAGQPMQVRPETSALPSPHALFHRDGTRRMRGGVIEPFPEKLHRLLLEVEAAGRSDVISFVAGGRAFAIHKPDKFFKEIVPLYFRQSRLSSFKRQLNLYGFDLINTGAARGGYYHELFVKDRPELCRRIRRVTVKSKEEADSASKEEGAAKELTVKDEKGDQRENSGSVTKDEELIKEPTVKGEEGDQSENNVSASKVEELIKEPTVKGKGDEQIDNNGPATKDEESVKKPAAKSEGNDQSVDNGSVTKDEEVDGND